MQRKRKRKLGYQKLEDRRMLAAVCPDCGPAPDPVPELMVDKQSHIDKQAHMEKQAQHDKRAQHEKQAQHDQLERRADTISEEAQFDKQAHFDKQAQVEKQALQDKQVQHWLQPVDEPIKQTEGEVLQTNSEKVTTSQGALEAIPNEPGKIVQHQMNATN